MSSFSNVELLILRLHSPNEQSASILFVTSKLLNDTLENDVSIPAFSQLKSLISMSANAVSHVNSS